MNTTEIIEILRQKLTVTGGRHLYGVLGRYRQLDAFARKLYQAKTPGGIPFPKPIKVNRGILETIPDDEFRELAENEAKRPEPTAAHVASAFEKFLRTCLCQQDMLVLANLELLFAYRVELNLLRTMAADDHRILLLLPGKRVHDRLLLFHESDTTDYSLPMNLIAENHLWEIRD